MAFLALLAVPAGLMAQQCIGQAPWSAGSLKAGGSIEFDGGTEIGGHVGVGKDGGFGFRAGAGVVTDGGPVGLHVGVNKEMSKKLGDKIAICPLVNAAYYLKKHGVSSLHVSGGLGGGYPVAMSSSTVGLIITGAAQLGFSKTSVDGDVCDLPGADCSSIFGLFSGGVGFIFNNRISLVPQIIIPTEGDIGFLILANVALGKKS
jgi:hypothetical protein